MTRDILNLLFLGAFVAGYFWFAAAIVNDRATIRAFHELTEVLDAH